MTDTIDTAKALVPADIGEMPLHEFLFALDQPPQDAEVGLVIEEEREADWAVRQYARYEQDAAAVDEQADALIMRINAWREQRKARYTYKLGFFSEALSRFFFRWRGEHTKEKSCPLPHGTIGERTQQPKVVKNDDELVTWMEENGLADLVKTKKSPNWAALRKLCSLTGNHPVFLPTGEEIPAVVLSYRPPTFYIKTSPSGERALIIEGEEADGALPEPEIE